MGGILRCGVYRVCTVFILKGLIYLLNRNEVSAEHIRAVPKAQRMCFESLPN
jgi:hypothetical protein